MTTATVPAGPGLATYVVLLVLVLAVAAGLAIAVRRAQRSSQDLRRVELTRVPPAPPRAEPDAGRPPAMLLVVATLSGLVPRPPAPPPVQEDEVIAFGLELELTDDVVGDVLRESRPEDS